MPNPPSDHEAQAMTQSLREAIERGPQSVQCKYFRGSPKTGEWETQTVTESNREFATRIALLMADA